MSRAFRLSAWLSSVYALTLPAIASDAPKLPPPQVVIISFDGAHDIAQWQRSRTLAQRTGARFTYFLSCVFLLSPDTKAEYDPPGQATPRSNVGFAASKGEVEQRLAQIRLAASEGHEIASHGCGHFDGKDWSKGDWLKEFASFSRIFRDAYEINGISPEPEDWRSFAAGAITGFRAPYLSTSPALYKALGEAGFAYDASGVSRDLTDADSKTGLVRYALPQIPEGPSARKVIAMDYNLFVRHSGGFDRPSETALFEQRAYDAFRAAFDREHDGARIPLQIGFHFTLMNDGAYGRALERFAGEVCVMPDVRCISYADDVASSATPRPVGTDVGG